MATKSNSPPSDQLEIDQLAEAELERLQKQVTSHQLVDIFFTIYLNPLPHMNTYLLIFLLSSISYVFIGWCAGNDKKAASEAR